MFSITLLCLASEPFSLPGPLDQLDPHHFEGTWAFVAGSLNHLRSMETLRLRDSITVFFTNSSETSNLSYAHINRFGDQCQYLSYNI